VSPRRNFGATWWGRAWAEALEGRAKLDPNRLPRGRTYARQGRVATLDVTAGEVRAFVQGSLSVPYKVKVTCRMFGPREWKTLLDTIGRRVGHTAALLDAELPPELADDARAAGVDLLPGPGELKPRCSCPDAADPCKHSAAVCYLVADEVDADPFVLFLLRGRSRDAVLGELRSRRTKAASVAEPPVTPGLSPSEAFARRPSALPPLPELPPHVGVPAVLPAPPAGWALWATTVAPLAADAAVRAWELLSHGDFSSLTFEEDLARRASSGAVEALSGASGVPVAELSRWASAWRVAGRGGLAALRETWQPPRGALFEAQSELADSDLPGETKVWRNRVTRGEIQLRLGRDGRWYPFRRSGGAWLPSGPGTTSALDALT
jgi:uncharacterized Zn finger protein